MANRADIEMLNHSLDEIANSGFRNRQLKQQQQQEMDRIMMQRELMQANQARYQQQDKLSNDRLTETTRHNTAMEGKANQPRVTAFIVPDPSKPNEGLSVSGTYDGIQGMADNIAKTKGTVPQILAKPPTDKPVHHSFKVGDMTVDTYSDEDTQKVTDQLKAQNIDPTKSTSKDPHEINIDPKKAYATANGHVILPKRSVDPTELENHTFKYPATPAVDADLSHNWYGKVTGTNSPAIPAKPEETVTRKVRVNETAAPVSTPSAPIATGNLPTVTTKEQHDSLPPGATYIGADGKKRVKAGEAPAVAVESVTDDTLTGDN